MASLCLGCMRLKNSSPVCEHCGFDERTQNLPHQLPVGTTLNNQYLVGRVLGQGGFGITYMGWDQNLAVPVAIKEYFPSGVVHRHTRMGSGVFGVNGEAPEAFEKHKQRFLKEARTLAQLADIPEIVQIRSFFSANGTAYIVMEYVQGITLKEHLKKLGRPMTEAEALAIMEPVLRGLQKVHDQGLIHRDISPDNIMLPGNGGIKLIDFGTVRYMDDSGKSKSTEAVLKPGFAPMEQYNTRGNLGTWTDVYAICATFHYLLTGRVPPEATERLEQGESLTVLRSRPGISGKLADALEQGMRLRVSDRLQTVQELHRLLYAPKQKAAPQPRKAAVKKESVKMAPAAKPAKKSGKLLLAAGLLAAVLAVGIGLSLTEKTPTLSSVPADPLPAQTVPEATVSPEELQYREAQTLESIGEYGKAAIAYARLDGYRDARDKSFEMWKQVPYRHTVCVWRNESEEPVIHALHQDGTVRVDAHVCNFCGDGLTDAEVLQHHTAQYEDVVALQASRWGVIGLRYDGTLLLPSAEDPYYRELAQWTDLVGISVVYSTVNKAQHDVYYGIRSDGTVVSAGTNTNGVQNVGSWTNITSVVSSGVHTLGLKKDGTVLAVGENHARQCNVETWTDVIAIVTGDHHSYGLRADGSMFAVGSNGENVITKVSQWKNIAVLQQAPMRVYPMAFQKDGTFRGPWYMESKFTDVAAVLSGTPHNLLILKKDGTLWGGDVGTNSRAASWTDIQIPYLPKTPPGIVAFNAEAYAEAEALLARGDTAKAAIAFGKLSGYKDARERSFALWDQVAVRETVATGFNHLLCLKNDGTVHAGASDRWRRGQCDVGDWTDIVAVSASAWTSVGLKADGTVVLAGSGSDRLRDVVGNWQDIVAIDVNYATVYGLKMDGTVVSSDGTSVPGWQDIVSIDAGSRALTGLKADGTAVTTGSADYSEWDNLIDVENSLGLRADGTVLTAGGNAEDFADWTDIVAISARAHTAGLRSDGTVKIQGWNEHYLETVSGWTDIVQIYTGQRSDQPSGMYVLGLKKDGTVVSVGNTDVLSSLQQWEDIVYLYTRTMSNTADQGVVIGLKADGTIVTNLWCEAKYGVSQWTDIKMPQQVFPLGEHARTELLTQDAH